MLWKNFFKIIKDCSMGWMSLPLRKSLITHFLLLWSGLEWTLPQSWKFKRKALMWPLQYFHTGLSMVQSASEDWVRGAFGVARGMHITTDSQGCMMLKKKSKYCMDSETTHSRWDEQLVLGDIKDAEGESGGPRVSTCPEEAKWLPRICRKRESGSFALGRRFSYEVVIQGSGFRPWRTPRILKSEICADFKVRIWC